MYRNRKLKGILLGCWCLHPPYYRPCLASGAGWLVGWLWKSRRASAPSAILKRVTCVSASLLAVSMTSA